MAGIGFQLKKLIAKGNYAGWLRAHIYGAVISAGPWLLSITTLATLSLLSRNIVRGAEHTLARSIIVYAYTFSLITTGAAQMVVTRHLADCLYVGDEGAFLRAFRWTIGTTALCHAALAAVFYALGPDLPPGVGLIGAVLFVVVACLWMTMVFVGAMRDYVSVVWAFLVGHVLSLGAALAAGWHWGVLGFLGGFTLGQAAIYFVLAARVEHEFAQAKEPQRRRGIRHAFRRYAPLAVAGFFYNLAISVDRLVFWASSEGVRVRPWLYGSLYDAPLFFAYVSIVPAFAIFLVNVETDFYDGYRRYYGVVTKHGTLRQVLEAKAGMTASLREGLRRLGLVQLPVTLGLIVLAPQLARPLALDSLQIAILRAALVGAGLHVLTLFGMIILLYFDRRRAALEVTGVLLGLNLGLTMTTLWLGPRFYGHGYALAALASALWAYRRLEETLADLEFLTFASQPLSPEVEPILPPERAAAGAPAVLGGS